MSSSAGLKNSSYRFPVRTFFFVLLLATLLSAGDTLLPNADLQNINLRNRDLHNYDLHGANLRNADLRGANLYGADLSGANLCCAKIKGANLTASDLTQANLSYVDFRGVALIEVILTQAFFENAIWTNGKRCGKGSIGKCRF
jgi:uncharacterized protein YjbI with pentapeptide repeats